jgi:cholesterol transport system auxiliary component
MKPILFIVILLFIPSCLNTQSIYPEKKYFLLEITQEQSLPNQFTIAPAKNQKNFGILRIAKIRMSPPYTGKGFIYKKSINTFDTDFYNEFLVSPDDMLAELIRKWMASSGLFDRVTCSPGHFKENYILEGAVTTMHGDYSDMNHPFAVFCIQFFLIKDSGLNYQLIFQKNYAKKLSIDKHNTQSLVQGWNKALTQIMIDFQSEIEKRIRQYAY